MGSLSMEVRTEVLCGYICDLKAENARLRELISILVHCMNEVDNCHTCPINGNPYDVRAGDWAACDTLRDMLLDMGVEVDG